MVDTYGQTLAVLRTAHQDTEAALRCLKTASRRKGLPETLPIAGRDAQEAAIQSANEAHGTTMHIRQITS